MISGQTYGVNSPVNSCDTLFAQDVNITYQFPSSATNGFVCTPGSNDGRVVVKGVNGARPYIINITKNCNGPADYIVMYPNPASSAEKDTAEINSSKTGSASIILNTEDGKQLQAQNIQLVSGTDRVAINIKGLAPGIYTVTLTDGKNINAKKVKLVIY